MSLTTDYADLLVTVESDPIPTAATVARRRRLLEELAWAEFANGPSQRTPRSAMLRAQHRYIPEIGRWVKACASCGGAFTSKRADAITCTEACRSRRHREGTRPTL